MALLQRSIRFFFTAAILLGVALHVADHLAVNNAIAESGSENSTVISELSPGIFLALTRSYREFERTGGRGSHVELYLPIPAQSAIDSGATAKIITARLRPHALGLNPASKSAKVKLFAGTLLTPRSDDFLRLALLYASSSSQPVIEGTASVDGILYRVYTTVDAPREMQIRRLEANEMAAMLAACATHAAHSSHDSDDDQIQTMLGSERARSGDATARMSVLKELEVATEADFEFVSGAGGSRNANAYILSILNSVDGIYRAQLGLTIRVVFQHTWTNASDPYSAVNPESLLNQFFAYWQNTYRSRVRYDVAHLFTGRALEFGVIGVAYTSSACQFQSYSLSQVIGRSGMDVPLTAHEIAHTLGAIHDSCGRGEAFVMCPVIVNGATNFSSRSLFDVASYVGAVNCLRETSTPSGNRYPELAPIGPQTVSENQMLVVTPSAVDPDGGLVTITATGMPPGGSFNGSRFEYQPRYDAVTGGQTAKEFTVTFIARDTGGLTDSETVVITVLNVNRVPRSAGDRVLNVAEGNVANSILDAFDPDGDPLIYYPTTALPRGFSIDTSSGRIAWRPGGNQAGVYHLRFQVVDPFGANDSIGLQVNVLENSAVPALRSRATLNDFDGDGRSDLSVYRGQSGTWYSTNLGSSALQSVQFGLPGDVPVAGDYNGDGVFDLAVFRPSESRWYIRNSGANLLSVFSFGLPGDLPFTGDFNGDGRTDIAIYRSNPGLIIYLSSADLRSNIVTSLGGPGFVPLAGNIDSVLGDDMTLFREGQFLAKSGDRVSSFALGGTGVIPAAADFDGDGRVELATFDVASGFWRLSNGAQGSFGLAGDLPMVGDFDGDGRSDRAVWRPGPAQWIIQLASGHTREQQFGLPNDQLPGLEGTLYGLRNSRGRTVQAGTLPPVGVELYVASSSELLTLGLSGLARRGLSVGSGRFVVDGDYDGDGLRDVAIFHNGVWGIYLGSGSTRATYWGVAGDQPVAADFDGDGKTDIAIWRPSGSQGVAEWFVIRSADGGVTVFSWGLKDDLPLPADFNGDGQADPAVFRPSMGMWFPLDARSRQPLSPQQWGLPGDQPRTADFDRDGRSDFFVWRATSGTWYGKLSGGTAVVQQWGLPGDVPLLGSFSKGDSTEFAVYRPRERQLYVNTAVGPRVVGLGGYVSVQSNVSVVGVAPFSAVN